MRSWKILQIQGPGIKHSQACLSVWQECFATCKERDAVFASFTIDCNEKCELESANEVNKMVPKSLFLPLLFVLLTSSTGLAGNHQSIINKLGLEIRQAQNTVAKSTFHIYRARQYTQIQEWKEALEDYNQALELNHQGWIHLERSSFLMAMGKYELAYEDAKAAKNEVPTLTQEADKLIEASVTALRKRYEAENPLTIIMDNAVDPDRKSRFDVMREQGVLAATTRRIDNFNRQKTASRKQQEAAACAPTKSRG